MAARYADRGGSIAARVLQVRRFCDRQSELAVGSSRTGIPVAAAAHPSARRHLVLYVPHDHVHRGFLPARYRTDEELLRVRLLCIPVLAARGGADRAFPRA